MTQGRIRTGLGVVLFFSYRNEISIKCGGPRQADMRLGISQKADVNWLPVNVEDPQWMHDPSP